MSGVRRGAIRILLSLLVLCSNCWRVAAQSANVTLTRLETDAAAQPLGIDERAPRFSWALDGRRRGASQTAYRVLVASRPELAREGRADVWDSGRVASSDPWVVYAGPALKSRTRYHWTVRVWATGGLAGGWAQIGRAHV